jgi:hypothetical protein
MEWVVDKLEPATVYRGNGGSGDDNFDESEIGDGGINPLSDNFTIEEYRDTEEFGIPKREFFSEEPRAARFGDGTWGIWKPHDTGLQSQDDAIRHEAVWSHAQELKDWDLGPLSRYDEAYIDGSDTEGTVQQWVDGAGRLSETVHLGLMGEPYDPSLKTKDEFLSDNMEWFARTTAVDYLLGNQDRHRGNIVIDGNGNPRAIDNGGAWFEDGLKRDGFIAPFSFVQYGRAENPDELHRLNHQRLDRIETYLDSLADDLEYRLSLIEQAEEIHGSDDDHYKRLVEVMGETVGPGHFMEEDENGVRRYRRHLNWARNLLDEIKDPNTTSYEEIEPDRRIGAIQGMVPNPTINDLTDLLDWHFGGKN